MSKEYVNIVQTLQDKWRKILKPYASTISLEYKTTYAHFHMFFVPHEENISSKLVFLDILLENLIAQRTQKMDLSVLISPTV